MAELLSVLAEPTWRRILDLLLEEPRTVNQLVGALGTSQPTASKHLRVLREAGLVHVHPDAQRRVYALRPRVGAALRDQTDELRAFLEIAKLRTVDVTLPPDSPLPAERAAAAARELGMNRLAERVEKLGE